MRMSWRSVVGVVVRAVRVVAGVACVAGAASLAWAGGWPTWGGTPARNMVSDAKGLPASFDPGEDRPGQTTRPATGNIKWKARLGTQTFGTPTVGGGKVFVGTNNGHPRDPKFAGDRGVLMCFRESDGEFLWQLVVPKLKEQGSFNGDYANLGICSSPALDGDRVYVVTPRCDVLCLDANGLANGNDGPVTDESVLLAKPKEETIKEDANGINVKRVPGEPLAMGPHDADVIWRYDMLVQSNIWPQDCSNCNILVHGDCLYVATSNGVDRSHKHTPCPKSPSLIVLDKKTGRLVAEDDAHFGPNILHGGWSSPSLGVVDGRTLIFFGGPDGFCYAFDAKPEPAGEGKPGKLKVVWKFDCNPPEYRVRDGKKIPYQLGHKPTGGEGPSECIGTAVFHKDRVYVDVGQDTLHGVAPGCLSCIDATKAGDISQTGLVWRCTEVDRTLSTVAVADGLVYSADYTGKLRCLEADTGKIVWALDTRDRIWSSPFLADGKVYMGTERGQLFVLAAGRELKELAKIRMDTAIQCTPIVANGVLYVTSATHLVAVKCQ
jgi:outer membrane protein assembly factor BamB